jgi:hypothetical protein
MNCFCRPDHGVLSVPFGDTVKESSALEDFDPYYSTHLLWEQINQLGFALRDITLRDITRGDITHGDITDEDIQQLIEAYDPVWDILLRIQRRKHQPTRKFLIFNLPNS